MIVCAEFLFERMKTPDPQLSKSGRDFAAWMGLTLRDYSTADRVRLGGITRAGDELLRSTLIVCATAVIRQAQRGRSRSASPWLLSLIDCKNAKVAAVALANKIARAAWN
jgi:transposase